LIDPKFNELPVEPEIEDLSDSPLSESERTERIKRRRAGLSIRDTVAGDTMLSTGARGVDTSGVSAGAGAGGGMTLLTPIPSDSASPEIVPGARGSGTTALGVASGQNLSASPERPDAETESGLDREVVARRAYDCWVRRGSPHGSAEEDWLLAERELRDEREVQPRAKVASA
jgi:hypothetical protein